jgi:8-oxo-dGTP diphosphatase
MTPIFKLGDFVLKEILSVTCFLEHENKILILLRSDRVRSYKGFWGGVSGRIQNRLTPLDQAKLEVKEETGISDGDIVSTTEGNVLTFDDDEIKIRKVVYPFLFKIKDPAKVKIDWEHSQSKWIRPAELASYQTMPQLKESLERVLSDTQK